MKLRNIFRILSAGAVLAGLASCHNQEKIFPDYEGGISAYFAYQMPVRTIVLGESETFDTSLDNQHKCIIYGTIGGSYKGKDVVIGIDVDETIAENVYYPDGTPAKVMPENYYTLSTDKLNYGGTHMGGVEVTLTDAFFADPYAIKTNYVIPVVMTDIIKGADQIKVGTPLIEGETPIRTNAALWSVQPMDYTLYGIKYVNPWDGSWLRRGVDVVTGQDAGENLRYVHNFVVNTEITDANGYVEPVTTVTSRKSYFYETDWKSKFEAQYPIKQYNSDKELVSTEVLKSYDVVYDNVVEYNEVVYLSTQSLNEVTMPVSTNISKTIQTTVTSNYALHMVNPAAQDANWKAQVWYDLAEPMKSGKTYTFKCKAAASEQYDCSVFLQSTIVEGQQNYAHGMSFPTEWKEVTMTVTPDKDGYDRLCWCFGDKAITLMLDDITFTEKGSDVNLITHCNFEDQTTEGWASYNQYEKIGPGEGGIKSEIVTTTEVNAKTCQVKLTFDANGNCTVSSATEGIAASGTGKYVKDGEKLAWGNKDRDGIYLDYTIDFGERQYAIKDTLVSRSREIKLETYTPTYKE